MKMNLLAGWRRMSLRASGLGLTVLTLTLPVCAPAADEQTFASPQDAVNALVADGHEP
jgi:hypothetical protein